MFLLVWCIVDTLLVLWGVVDWLSLLFKPMVFVWLVVAGVCPAVAG